MKYLQQDEYEIKFQVSFSHLTIKDNCLGWLTFLMDMPMCIASICVVHNYSYDGSFEL